MSSGVIAKVEERGITIVLSLTVDSKRVPERPDCTNHRKAVHWDPLSGFITYNQHPAQDFETTPDDFLEIVEGPFVIALPANFKTADVLAFDEGNVITSFEKESYERYILVGIISSLQPQKWHCADQTFFVPIVLSRWMLRSCPN